MAYSAPAPGSQEAPEVYDAPAGAWPQAPEPPAPDQPGSDALKP